MMINKRYNILHLRKSFERNLPIFISCVQGVDNNKYRHLVCYLGKENGTNKILELGYETIYMGFDKKAIRWFNPLVALRLIKIIRENSIDLIHAHKHKPTIYAVIASLFCKNTSVISHIHGLSRTRNLRRKILNIFIYRFVDKIIAVSDSVKHDIITSNFSINDSKIVTIRNCIDLKAIDNSLTSKELARKKIGLPEDAIVFGTVGRLVETKGHRFLIEAFSKIINNLKNPKLVIVGDGPLYQDLKKQVEDLNIKEYVLFTGFREDVLQIIRGFDVFLLPSLAEGLSIALLEAMASCLPVIASNVGGIPEVFGDSQCGILVPPKDIESLRDAMLKMATLSEGERKKLGENGRARIKKEFTIEKMIMNLTNLYDSILFKSNKY